MDKDEADYWIDHEITPIEGRWQGESYPVRDAADVPFSLVAVVVKADQSCADELRRMIGEDEWQMAALPSGLRGNG